VGTPAAWAIERACWTVSKGISNWQIRREEDWISGVRESNSVW